MKYSYLILVLFVFIASCDVLSQQKSHELAQEKSFTFSKVDFKGDDIYVELKEESYKWLKIDTLEISKIADLFKENYGFKWQQRFSEDFVEYSNKLNIYPKQHELFVLEDLRGNIKTITLKFSTKNRDKAKNHYEVTYDKDIDLNKVLTREEVIADLDQLEQLIAKKYSYAFLNNVNIHEEIQLLKNVKNGIRTYDFALEIGRLLNKFGDGHTRIHNVQFKKNGILPFSVKPFNDRVVCLKGGKLLNEEYPFLHAINEVGLSRLLELSEEYLTPDASPQYKERVKVARLNRIGELLRKAEAENDSLKVDLISKDGQITSLDMEMGENKRNRDNTPFEIKHFEDLGYLRIKTMVPLSDNNWLTPIIGELKNKKGLIIDVRNNGGGLRDILLELAPHFINRKQGFVVGNVARLRSDNPIKTHDLSDRYLYRLDDQYFDEAKKVTLKAWSEEFSPKIELKDSLYSPNYFLYIEAHQEPSFSNTPTVILLNEGCYSATDIFLSTFKEIDGVTLIGTPSGGGSGRSRRYKLTNSAIELRLSSIVSFQPNGSLYDGVGVSPDIEVAPSSMSDLLGDKVSQLELALNFLNEND